MNKILFLDKISWLAYALFFLAVFSLPSKTLLAVDTTEEQLRPLQEVKNPGEIPEEIEDISFKDDLSDEALNKVLTVTAPSISEKQKEAERNKQLVEQQRLEKEKSRLTAAQKKLETPMQNEFVQQETTTKSVPRNKIFLKELEDKLGLTDKQLERLTPIMKDKASKRSEVLSKYAGKGDASRSALKQELLLFQKYYDDMYAHILSEEQLAKYMAMRQGQK